MMDLPAPAPIYCNVIDVDFDAKQTYYFDDSEERAGPLLKLSFSDADKEDQSISVVAVFERMGCDGDPLTIVGRLLPQNSDSTREALVSLTEQPEVFAQWVIDEQDQRLFHTDQRTIQLAIVSQEELAVNLDETLLPPASSHLKISLTTKTGIVDQLLCFAFYADEKINA